jgi:formylglycine-generating enzyme required for sulfatase activity
MGEFVKGKLHGRGKQYNHKGQLIAEGVWENGKFTGNSSKAENNKKSSIKTPPLGEEFTVPSISMEMIWCPPGTFTMGSPISEKGRIDDEFQHQVTLTNGFHLGKYEVTQAQWERVMGNNPSSFKGSNRPVENVSWKDAVDFCRKLNSIEKKAGRVAQGKSYQLPTEAQWEYACRAYTTTAYSWGNYLSDSQANYNWNKYDNRKGETHNVGNYAANPWGFFDMHGNVLEWTADWYHYSSGNPVFDPSGPASGSRRVLRGGAWGSAGTQLRSAKRISVNPNDRNEFIGFRVGFHKSL